MKKWWAKVLLGLGVVLLVLWVMLLTSSIHSKSALDQYKDQLRAAGEKLNIDELLPPPVEPEKNGASLFDDASRYMGPYAVGVLGTNEPPAMRMVAPGKAMIGWQQSEIVAFLTSGFITNSWDDIERELQGEATALDLLRQAAECPQLDFGFDYKQGFITIPPYLIKMKEAALLLSPASVDALHRGDSFEAITNVHTLVSLVNGWNEPVLIFQLVRNAMLQMAVPVQWELLQATNLTDEQLAFLQRDWTKAEFVKSMDKALEMERAWESMTFQQLRTSNSPSAIFSGYPFATSSGGGSGGWFDDLKQAAKRKTSDTLWRISWSYSDELAALKGDEVLIEATRQAETNGYFRDALSERDRKLIALGLSYPSTNWLRNELDDDLLALADVKSVSHSLDRLLSMEAARRMTITAIALKRYQLRHGSWPPDLSALVPEFLPEIPRDPVDGKPLRYRPNPDGTFLLYSVGSDGKDGGGDVSPLSPRPIYWLRAPDWVWPQPATAAEIQKYYDNLPK